MKEGQEGFRTTLTQSDHEIIRAFLASIPAGFPPSPGAALAELTGFSPLSPGLSGQTNACKINKNDLSILKLKRSEHQFMFLKSYLCSSCLVHII